MKHKQNPTNQDLLKAEQGTIYKKWQSNIRVALVYPNYYAIGMSNLGFQVVYASINSIDGVLCERAFLPERRSDLNSRISTLESNHFLSEFDIIAFSVSFENDYTNILQILERSGIPIEAAWREKGAPLVMAGGAACMLNPEPLAPFMDLFLIGEIEGVLEKFFYHLDLVFLGEQTLERLAQEVPGVYIPAFYEAEYDKKGRLKTFLPKADVPTKIKRLYPGDLSNISTCTSILTPNTTFSNTFLVEGERGCPHGCRFCTAGFIYRPPRYRPYDRLAGDLSVGASMTDSIGLVGAAVSEIPDLDKICRMAEQKGLRLSFSSLRADMLSDNVLQALKRNRTKTATIAPDAGSQRMRNVINKGLDEETLLAAAARLVSKGIPNLKLYFMVGLPTETDEDVDAIISLCRKLKHEFLKTSRAQKKIGDISVSLNAFVPKPFTPFQWVGMAPLSRLKENIKRIKTVLNKVPNIRVHSDIPRWAYIQGLLSRGDRRVGQILYDSRKAGDNWPKAFKESQINADFFVLRERAVDELFPWDFIDHGIRKSFLWEEYQKSLTGKRSDLCRPDQCNRCGVCRQ